MPDYDIQRRGTWYQSTRILTPPDLQGQGERGRGQAWRIDLDAARRATQIKDGSVSAWIVHAPGAHLCWDHYIFSIIHLREVEGMPAPTLRYPDATHEMLIMALDPGFSLPDPRQFIKCAYLQPADFIEQCRLPDDAAADELLETLVILAVDGLISPDTDYRQVWTAALWQTAKRLNPNPSSHDGDGAKARRVRH